MYFVEIYKLQNDGEQKLFATCRLVDGKVRCDGDPGLIDALERGGIKDYSDPKLLDTLYPKDGIKFLEGLKFALRSAYLAATEVKESKD